MGRHLLSTVGAANAERAWLLSEGVFTYTYEATGRKSVGILPHFLCVRKHHRALLPLTQRRASAKILTAYTAPRLPFAASPRPGPHRILPSDGRTPNGGCGGGGGGSATGLPEGRLAVPLAFAQNGGWKLALCHLRRQRLAAQHLHLAFALKPAITCCQTAVWRPRLGRQHSILSGDGACWHGSAAR